MRSTRPTALLSALAASASLVLAAHAAETDGRVIEISIEKDYGNYAFIKVDVPPTAPVACSQNGYWQYTLPLVSEADKRIFSMVMTSYLTQRAMHFRGLGSCNEFGAVESLAGARLRLDRASVLRH